MGRPEGCPVGRPVGCLVGRPVGCLEGRMEGCPVGRPVGTLLGWPEGCPVGAKQTVAPPSESVGYTFLGHKVQSAPADAEYVCSGQFVQEVPPVDGVHTAARLAGKAVTVNAVPVDWPALQLAQAVVEASLNLAMAHAVHEMAPVAASVLVTEPGLQAVQLFSVQEAVQIGVGEGAGVPPSEGVRRYLPAAH